MKILVTGANGFIGKNLVTELHNIGKNEILKFDLDTPIDFLDEYTGKCDFVFHLAGINRPDDDSEFITGNVDFTSNLLNSLIANNNKCPIMISSSTQAILENSYGRSKRAGEELIFNYGKKYNVKTLVYRFPNVFGKWCKPNYNSAVATFCNNIANDIPIKMNDPSVKMNLIYIDDVVKELINALQDKEQRENEYCFVLPVYQTYLGEIVKRIYSFKNSRNTLSVPVLNHEFEKKLYSTYISYLPKDKFSYDLKMNVDQRGSFTEFIKTPDRGQVSINISKSGITKGNHWHHTKNEKFLVVSGKGVIRFRKINSAEIIEYFVSGDKLQVVDIPVGYTHNIENLGETEMVTVMWVNEILDQRNPDTYFEKV